VDNTIQWQLPLLYQMNKARKLYQICTAFQLEQNFDQVPAKYHFNIKQL